MGERKAVVVGSGFVGLAAAVRLQSAGVATTLVDRRDRPGGRAYVYEDAGFTFDGGPTVISAPEALEEVFAAAGRRLADYVTLVPVRPFYRLFWENGYRFDYSNDPVETARQIITSQYGKEYLSDTPRVYQTKGKNAQEAHEAIRPTGRAVQGPARRRHRGARPRQRSCDLPEPRARRPHHVRTDGTPTYNFCAVVDDADMQVTHIIRGEDHLTNTPKHIQLNRAKGDASWEQEQPAALERSKAAILERATDHKKAQLDMLRTEAAFWTQVAQQANLTQGQISTAQTNAMNARRQLRMAELAEAASAARTGAPDAERAERDRTQALLAEAQTRGRLSLYYDSGWSDAKSVSPAWRSFSSFGEASNGLPFVCFFNCGSSMARPITGLP